jgi:alkyl sulfatase BDS1-like metallo-beta-lactamase superfamily hydrolase
LPTPRTRRPATFWPTRWTQLGYQAGSGPWRNFYLTGAQELREGVAPTGAPSTTSPDVVRALPLDLLLDCLAVLLNGPEAAGREISLNFTMPDIGEEFTVLVENGVLNYTIGAYDDDADANDGGPVGARRNQPLRHLARPGGG